MHSYAQHAAAVQAREHSTAHVLATELYRMYVLPLLLQFQLNRSGANVTGAT
jgi:hypothetical protein